MNRLRNNIAYAKKQGENARVEELKIERADYKKIKKENKLSLKAKVNEPKPK